VGFITPFQTSVWVALLITTVLFQVVIILGVKKVTTKSWFMVFSLFMETGDIPQEIKV
jgi:hypothetical protein